MGIIWWVVDSPGHWLPATAHRAPRGNDGIISRNSKIRKMKQCENIGKKTTENIRREIRGSGHLWRHRDRTEAGRCSWKRGARSGISSGLLGVHCSYTLIYMRNSSYILFNVPRMIWKIIKDKLALGFFLLPLLWALWWVLQWLVLSLGPSSFHRRHCPLGDPSVAKPHHRSVLASPLESQ